MSFQFLRNLNKNVKESLSILNEGLEITNGIAEVSKLHLPYILQLLPPQNGDTSGLSTCCVFVRNAAGVSDESNPDGTFTPISRSAEQSKDTPSHDGSVDLAPGGSHRTSPKPDNTTSDTDGDAGDAIQRVPCTLGDRCLLRQINPTTYSEALESIFEFLGSVENAMETQSNATRNLLETQALPVLCGLITTVKVADFLRKPNAALSETFSGVTTLSEGMFNVVASSLKLMNRILVYPEEIRTCKNRRRFEAKLTPNLRSAYDSSSLNRRVKNSGTFNHHNHIFKGNTVLPLSPPGGVTPPREGFSAYDYLGKVGVLILKEHEKERLQYLLSLLQSVGIATDFGRTLMAAAGVCLGGFEIFEKEIVDNTLHIIEKMYTHNDLNWLLHQDDDQKLYTVDKLDEFYTNWQMCCNGLCCACDRPLGIREIPESIAGLADSTWCSCIISRNDLVSPNRHLIEEEIVASPINPYRLLKLALETSDMAVKTRITGLMLQMVLNSASFRYHFVETGCIDVVLDILNTCYMDQFSVLNDAIDGLTYENLKKALNVENELVIGMSFVPCSLDCIMILRHCLKTEGCKPSYASDVVRCVTHLSMTMIKIWIYCHCVDRDATHEVDSTTFTEALCIVIDMCISLIIHPGFHIQDNVSKSEKKMASENLPLVAVRNLVTCQHSADTAVFREVVETGIVEHVLCAAHLICCRTRFAPTVDERVFDQLMRFSSTVFLVSKSSSNIHMMLIERLKNPIGSNMPAIYSCIYEDLQSRDIEGLKTMEGTSQQEARLGQLRMEMIGDVVNIPILSHWMLTLNDTNVKLFPKEAFRHPLWHMMAASNLFDGNDNTNSIMEYVQGQYKEALTLLERGDVGYRLETLVRQLITPLDIALALLAVNTAEQQSKSFPLFEKPWQMGIDALNATMKALQIQYQGILIEILNSVMTFFVSYLCLVGEGAKNEDVFMGPILVIMNFDETSNQHLTLRWMSAFVLTLGYALGIPLYEERVDLDLLVAVSEDLRALYMSDEHRHALDLLKELETPIPVDTLTEDWTYILQSFLYNSHQAVVSNALNTLLWDRTNIDTLLLSSTMHVWIKHFRQMLHAHVMASITLDMQDYVLVHKDEIKMKCSKTDEEIERMRQLHKDELAFAQDRIAKMTSQVNVMADSYYLAEANIKSMREELDLVMSENLALREQLKNTTTTTTTNK